MTYVPTSRPTVTSLRVCRWCLWGAILIYSAAFTWLSFQRFHQGAPAYDIGIFDQAVWLISRGHEPFVMVRGVHILADHFSVILYLLAPLYWVWSDARMLLIAQTVALSLGAWPVFVIARRRTESPVAGLVLACAYLLYSPLQYANVHEFHPESFAIPLILAAWASLLSQRWVSYFLLLLLASTTKETTALIIVLIGVVVAFRVRPRWVGVGTIVTGFVLLMISSATIRYFGDNSASAYWWLYSEYGTNPYEIITFIFGNFFTVSTQLLGNPNNQQSIFQLLYPFAFLSVLRPDILSICLPILLLNFLSRRSSMHTIYFHYMTLVIPFIVLSSVEGIVTLQKWSQNRRFLFCLLPFVSLFCLEAATHGPSWRSTEHQTRLAAVRQNEINEAMRLVAPDASVSAQLYTATSFTHRKSIYLFPNPFVKAASGNGVDALYWLDGGEARRLQNGVIKKIGSDFLPDYVILSKKSSTFPLTAEDFRRVSSRLEQGLYERVYDGVDIFVLRRMQSRFTTAAGTTR